MDWACATVTYYNSKLLVPVVYFSDLIKLVYGPFDQSNMHSTLDVCRKTDRNETYCPDKYTVLSQIWRRDLLS